MKTIVIFYSRSGITRRLARHLAGRLGADMSEITCARYGGGFISYWRAAIECFRDADVPVGMPESAAGYDLVLLGGPVWVGRAAVPLRSYLAAGPVLPSRIGVFLTSGNSGSNDKVFAALEALLPTPPLARLSMSEAAVKAGTFGVDVDDFVNTLGASIGLAGPG